LKVLTEEATEIAKRKNCDQIENYHLKEAIPIALRKIKG